MIATLKRLMNIPLLSIAGTITPAIAAAITAAIAAAVLLISAPVVLASKDGKETQGHIDIDNVGSDEEFAALFPDYVIRFTGLVDRDVEISFSDIIRDYGDRVDTRVIRGERTDGETVDIEYTGIALASIIEEMKLKAGAMNIIVYGSDNYSADLPLHNAQAGDVLIVWKKDGAYMVPSQDGVLKVVQQNGLTKKWVKNPVLFDFVAEYIDAVPLQDRPSRDDSTFVSQDQLFTLSILRTVEIDAREWELKVGGLVQNPVSYSYDDILGMPQESVYAVLETISNPPGGRSIGNAIWTGVPMKYILEQVSPESTVQEIVFKCADGYSTSITLEEAMQKGVQLCYRVNGETMLAKHGFPLRLVLPEKYGMKWAKWIEEIEFVDYDYRGYWERRGWSDYAGRDRPDQRYD
jgi:DMSO/TMAO reductase YedYZ molybdopterin-dependent catalytic subunit